MLYIKSEEAPQKIFGSGKKPYGRSFYLTICKDKPKKRQSRGLC